MEVTAMMTFPTSHTITYHREMMAMINPRYRYSLQAKKQWEQNPTPQNVNSDEVSGQIEASAIITDSPDEASVTENPQAIGGETSMEEDASNPGRPQRARQGPKRPSNI